MTPTPTEHTGPRPRLEAEPWTLTRVEAGVYTLTVCGAYLADVKRGRLTPWIVLYASRAGRWRRFEEFSTLKDAKAWIGEHLDEVAGREGD